MEAWSDRKINKPPCVDAPLPMGKNNKNRGTPSFRTPGFDSLKTPDMQRSVNSQNLFKTMLWSLLPIMTIHAPYRIDVVVSCSPSAASDDVTF